MDPDEKTLHEHVIAQYRTALSDTQFELAQANARHQVKDKIIAELMEKLNAQAPAEGSPKPGPPPAR